MISVYTGALMLHCEVHTHGPMVASPVGMSICTSGPLRSSAGLGPKRPSLAAASTAVTKSGLRLPASHSRDCAALSQSVGVGQAAISTCQATVSRQGIWSM